MLLLVLREIFDCKKYCFEYVEKIHTNFQIISLSDAVKNTIENYFKMYYFHANIMHSIFIIMNRPTFIDATNAKNIS